MILEQPPVGRASPEHTGLPLLTKEGAFDAFQVCNMNSSAQRQLRLVILFWCEALQPTLCWRILIRQILLAALTCWMVFGDLAGGAGEALVEAGIS